MAQPIAITKPPVLNTQSEVTDAPATMVSAVATTTIATPDNVVNPVQPIM